jgi:hypothetical protein
MAANVSLSPVPDWDDVLRIGLALPDVEESTSYRLPSLKVRGRTFLNMSPHEPGALVVHVPVEEQPLRIAARPDVYFLTPHYQSYGCVLLRLNVVEEDELAGAIEDAWEHGATAKRRRQR